ncbi:uncharacterized protein V1518DRAFT_458187 [Limtongia smithiae]|uniref:uncharacterized protein n=1 Tax=Limtongia smithiae TaxID=1125753 RepID=UPI0034CFFEB1
MSDSESSVSEMYTPPPGFKSHSQPHFPTNKTNRKQIWLVKIPKSLQKQLPKQIPIPVRLPSSSRGADDDSESTTFMHDGVTYAVVDSSEDDTMVSQNMKVLVPTSNDGHLVHLSTPISRVLDINERANIPPAKRHKSDK